MKTKEKTWKGVVATVLCFVMAFTVTTIGANNTQAVNASVRTATLNESAVEYATFFSEFDDAELLIDKENNALKFSGTKTLSSDLFEEIDFVGISGNDSDGIAVRYIFDYNANTNEFYLSVIADTENGEIIDKWFGVPFTDENGEIDIAFATDDGIIYLSELQDSGVLENCGWFSRILKKVAKVAAVVAAVAVVVAVVVVAAPAVAAAATTVSTAVAVGGGAAAFTTGTATAAVAAAAAAGAAAMGTTAFAIAATTALVAATTAVTAYLAATVFETFAEKVQAAAKELSKLKEYEGTMIFRADLTGNAYKTLTPRKIDTNGLSCFNNIGYMFGALYITYGVYITTTQLVSGTGLLYAKKDGEYHYSICPVNGNMVEWIATYSTAKTNPHKYTKLLKEVCFYVEGI